MVEIVEHRAEWRERFDWEAARIRGALGETARRRYEAHKRELATAFDDQLAYAEAKTPLIRAIEAELEGPSADPVERG